MMLQHAIQPQPRRQRQVRAAHCLIIEDSEFDQAMMKRVMARSKLSLKVEIANTLQRAREVLDRGGVHLILLDNNLPDGWGTNFAVELSKDSALSKIPVVMVSDWPTPFMFDKALAAGVLHVVNKSEFDARYVHAAVKAANKGLRRLH